MLPVIYNACKADALLIVRKKNANRVLDKVFCEHLICHCLVSLMDNMTLFDSFGSHLHLLTSRVTEHRRHVLT